MTWTGRPSTDRRVQRTQRLLHDALGALIHEKAYDAIAVKEILERANVGRSTFYAHYRDKDELLVSGIRALLRSGRSTHRTSTAPPRDLLWFSRPLFEHVEHHRRTHGGEAGPERLAVVHAHLERAIRELVADELTHHHDRKRRPDRSDGDAEGRVSSELLARHVAATFALVLDWWVESGDRCTGAQADDRFRALVLPVVAAWSSMA